MDFSTTKTVKWKVTLKHRVKKIIKNKALGHDTSEFDWSLYYIEWNLNFLPSIPLHLILLSFIGNQLTFTVCRLSWAIWWRSNEQISEQCESMPCGSTWWTWTCLFRLLVANGLMQDMSILYMSLTSSQKSILQWWEFHIGEKAFQNHNLEF